MGPRGGTGTLRATAGLRIRRYRPADAPRVGRLIATTFGDCNLGHLDEADRDAMLGSFAHADSDHREHRRAIADAIDLEVVLVAVREGEVIGVLRGRRGRLASLFVAAEQHRRGIGSALVARFEEWVAEQGGGSVKVSSTLFGVPFYRAAGYRKTTGIRRMRSFGGDGLRYQPMKKDVAPTPGRSAR